MCQALLAHSWHFEKVSFRSAGVPNAHSPLASAQALHQTGGHHLKVSCVQRVTALPPTFQDPTHHRPIPLILDWLQLSPPVSDKDEDDMVCLVAHWDGQQNYQITEPLNELVKDTHYWRFLDTVTWPEYLAK